MYKNNKTINVITQSSGKIAKNMIRQTRLTAGLHTRSAHRACAGRTMFINTTTGAHGAAAVLHGVCKNAAVNSAVTLSVCVYCG